jgi:DNA-directed RNA polymerase subunit B
VDYGQEGTGITHTAKVISAARGRRSQLIIDLKKDGIFYANLQGHKIPAVILMIALGVYTPEIFYAVSPDPAIHHELIPSVVQAEQILPRLEIPPEASEEEIKRLVEEHRKKVIEAALDYIGSRFAIGRPREERIARAQRLLDERLLPHIGTDPSREIRLQKAVFIGQMIARIIELKHGLRKPDDKDHYRNKRLKLAGDLLATLIRASLTTFIRDLREELERQISKTRKAELKTAFKHADKHRSLDHLACPPIIHDLLAGW